MKLSIIIPIYNEKETVLEILDIVKKAHLPEAITEREIIVVEDFSNDGTRDILKNINDSGVSIFYHERNQGKGAGIRTGLKNATGDIIIIQDADLEYDPGEYSKLLEPVLNNKADVVFGSRFINGQTQKTSYLRYDIMNKFLTLLSNVFSGLSLTDMETGYKVFKKEIFDQIGAMEENRFGFEPEITAKIGELSRTKNVRIHEMGISYFGRTYDEGKKIGWKDGVVAVWCILKYNTSKLAYFVKYCFNGLIVALSQVVSIYLLVQYFNFNTSDLQQIANIISIEVSILVGLFLHSFVTWNYKYKTINDFFKIFIYFHSISGVSFLIRILLFPILASFGFNYMLNTLIGVAVATIINFFGFGNIVFKKKGKDKLPFML
jgi:glycosyltransferase involved in cell wall biosynthesis